MNIQRDSYASYFGHHTTLQYFAVAENESIGRVKYNFMQVSTGSPTGPPPSPFVLDLCPCRAKLALQPEILCVVQWSCLRGDVSGRYPIRLGALGLYASIWTCVR